MATPGGILYSREAILENLLAQKKANKRKLAAWESQQAGETRKVGPCAADFRARECGFAPDGCIWTLEAYCGMQGSVIDYSPLPF